MISKLRWSTQEDSLGPDEEWISPLDLDLYCNNGTETALQHVVKTREHTITHRLLQAGANPNLIIYAAQSPESIGSHSSSTGSMNESQPPPQTYFKGKMSLVYLVFGVTFFSN